MPNILFVLNFASSFEGSFIRSIKALGDEVERNGGKAVYMFEQGVKNTPWMQKFIEDGTSVYFFKDKVSSILPNTFAIKKIIKKYKINIVHSHFANYREHIPISLAVSGNKKIDYIVHVHKEPTPKKPLYERLSTFITNATLYVAVNEAIKNKLTICGKRAITVENAVDFSRLEFIDHSVEKESFLSSPDQKTVFMFGQDFDAKGVDFVIKTLMDYDTQHKFALLVAVSENMDSAVEQVKTLCGEVPSWIKLLPARNDIATYFSLADVFVLANRMQGSPYTMIECAYLGIPIVYCDLPGQNELNIPWSVGIHPEDSSMLYRALCEIVKEDEAETQLMGKESREYVVNHFSLGSWVFEIINIYKNIGRI